MLGADVGTVSVAPLVVLEPGASQQLDVADDRVERGADLVAHGRHKVLLTLDRAHVGELDGAPVLQVPGVDQDQPAAGDRIDDPAGVEPVPAWALHSGQRQLGRVDLAFVEEPARPRGLGGVDEDVVQAVVLALQHPKGAQRRRVLHHRRAVHLEECHAHLRVVQRLNASKRVRVDRGRRLRLLEARKLPVLQRDRRAGDVHRGRLAPRIQRPLLV